MPGAGKFGMAEAVVLITMSSMARIFLPFPGALVETAGEAAWISALAGLVLALFQVYLLYSVLKRHPGKNIVEVTGESLGVIGGTAANVIFIFYFIVVGAIFTRTFSEALLLSALPRTPISVVTTGYVAMALLGSYVGIEAMARSARVTYPFVVTGIAILLFSLIPHWDLTQLFPVLGNGPSGIIRGGIAAGAVTEILFSAVIANCYYGPAAFGKITARAMLMGYAYLTLLEFILLATVLWSVAQEYSLPFYSLSRLIYLGRYFQRVEAIFIIIWGYIGIVKVVITLYGAAVTMAGAFRLPDYRPLIWPLALVMFVLSLLPPDLPTAVEIESVYIRLIAWLPTVIIPALVLAVGRLRNRRKKDDGG